MVRNFVQPRIITGVLVLAVIGLVASIAYADNITLDWIDEDLGIAGGHFGTHDFLIPPGEAHTTPPPGPAQTEAAHWSWVSATPPAVLTNVNYFIDNHGGNTLTATQIQRIQDAAGVWNTSGAGVSLTQVGTDALADLHVHGANTSACGGTAIGCAAFSYFIAHNPVGYSDLHPQHLMAGNMTSPGIQVMTLLTRTDWYTGANSGGIGGAELDYMTVAIQEFGHHLGLAHNDSTTGHPSAEFSISPMNGILPFGVARRVLQSSDTAAITHLYGAAAAVPEPSILLLLSLGLAGLVVSRKRNA